MFISKMSLPRRTFLRGLGATLALPFLDAMVPAVSMLSAAARPPRSLSFIYVPNGVIQGEWIPSAVGPEFELSRTLLSLALVKVKINVVSGLAPHRVKSLGDADG